MVFGTRQAYSCFGLLLALLLVAVFSAGGCSRSGSGVAERKKYEVAGDDEPASVPDTGSLMDRASPPAGLPGEVASPGKTSPPSGLSPSTDRGVPKQPPLLAGEKLGGTAVPDGSPQELMQYIEQLFQRANAPDMTLAEAKVIFENILTAAERIVTAGASVSERQNAVNIWWETAQMLSQQLDPQGPWGERKRAFGQKLTADADPGLSAKGKAILFSLRVNDVLQGKEKDTNGFMKELKSLLAEEGREAAVLAVTQQGALALRAAGKGDLEREAFQLIGESFKDHADPALADGSANILEFLAMQDLQIESKLQDVAAKKEGAADVFLAAITSALSRPKPKAVALEEAEMSVDMLEQTGNYELGQKVCDLILAAYKDSADEVLKMNATQFVDQAKIRLQMVGKPLAVAGTLLDGTALDFNAYQGKVVLVAFWTIQDGQCNQAISHVLQTYQGYREKGFDVVGVALDRDVPGLRQLLTENPLPWQTITSVELVRQCGVRMIPFLILLDAQGNVVTLHARGKVLEQKLSELLGPPANTPAPTAGDNGSPKPADG